MPPKIPARSSSACEANDATGVVVGARMASHGFPSRARRCRLPVKVPDLMNVHSHLPAGHRSAGTPCAVGLVLLLAFWLCGIPLSAQGLVIASSWSLHPPQPIVADLNAGANGAGIVAQVVYGPRPDSLTNRLGEPMPVSFTPSSSEGFWGGLIRTLDGFVEGDKVYMRVYAWNVAMYSGFEEARQHVETGGTWSCRFFGPAYGASDVFVYRVGSLSDPESLMLVNFRSFRMQRVEIWPGYYIADVLGGGWIRRVEATEDTGSVTLDLRSIPPRTDSPFIPRVPVEFPPGTAGDEPFGSAVRRVTAGKPMALTGLSDGWRSPEIVVLGTSESVPVGVGQSVAETSLVAVEGTVGEVVVRLKRPFVGRVELEMRYPLENPVRFGGCVSYPRTIAVDIRPSGTPVRVSLATRPNPTVRLRLESGRSHSLQKSYDLASWQEIGAYEVGFPLCVPLWPPNCGTHDDPDGVYRFADFEFPLDRWHASNDSRPVFFRVRSR